MEDLISCVAIYDFMSFIELAFMAARNSPKTSIVDRSVLQGYPEANQRLRVIIQEGGVLVVWDFASYLRGL